MFIETDRLIIIEFTLGMAKTVQENSVDEDNKRFVPDEVWETGEEAEISEIYGTCQGVKREIIRNVWKKQ